MIAAHEYATWDAVETARLIANKSVQASEVLDAAARGIEELNPQLNAVVHLDVERAHAMLAEHLQHKRQTQLSASGATLGQGCLRLSLGSWIPLGSWIGNII